jgi:hypothetical protein
MSRRDHQEAITKHIQKHNPGFKYEKNQAGMRKLLNKYGDEEKAIRYAEQGAATYTDKRYSQHNPCTMVYKLVRQLRGEDTDFNKKLQTR